jgi:hypothetical protein
MIKIIYLLLFIICLIYLFNNIINNIETFGLETQFKPKIILTNADTLIKEQSEEQNQPNNTNNTKDTKDTKDTKEQTQPNNTNDTKDAKDAMYSKGLLADVYKHKYVGCYKDYPETYDTRRIRNKVSDKPITLEECNNFANNAGFKVYGFQNYDNFTGKGDCYVDNDLNRAVNFDTTLSDSKLIKGDCANYKDKKVGLENSNAVYTTISPLYEYVGCFKDDGKKYTFDVNKRYIRFAECQGLAENENYKYFGIQDWGRLHVFKGNCFLSKEFNNKNLEPGLCSTSKAHTILDDLSLLSDRIVGVSNSNAIYKRIDVE